MKPPKGRAKPVVGRHRSRGGGGGSDHLHRSWQREEKHVDSRSVDQPSDGCGRRKAACSSPASAADTSVSSRSWSAAVKAEANNGSGDSELKVKHKRKQRAVGKEPQSSKPRQRRRNARTMRRQYMQRVCVDGK